MKRAQYCLGQEMARAAARGENKVEAEQVAERRIMLSTNHLGPRPAEDACARCPWARCCSASMQRHRAMLLVMEHRHGRQAGS
jgi:hypothetical protein